ncbi:response regulator Mcs4 [Schizosaccharomyces octosporus yFS286]|uniref:Response regulator Mcs4 n=1 Tax=Schizosaccharomyces octosporus (strain yFS286) TaxID=483514 RepID=S9RBT0_SCHOY|nr:response regulator Mcs4 [Schizosaccharomyces octosporus yFS286]EPX71574.1 response regulator Mcs4 [Schizosaccharomyces octosporus yFS286]
MRVWFKKLPDGVISSVLVSEESLVDDLKDAITQKFPLRIGQHVDAPELNIRLNIPKNGTSDAQTRDLEPNDNILLILNYYFPHGQTMDDALLVSAPAVSSAQTQLRGSSLPSTRSNSYEMTTNNSFSENVSASQLPNSISESSSHHRQSFVSELSESPSNNSLHRVPSNSYFSKGSSVGTPTGRSAGRTRSNTLVNKPGVLLLPRYSRHQSNSNRSGVSDHASNERSSSAVNTISKQTSDTSVGSTGTIKAEQSKPVVTPKSSSDSLFNRPNSSPFQNTLVNDASSMDVEQMVPSSTVNNASGVPVPETLTKSTDLPQLSYSDNPNDSITNSPVNVLGTDSMSGKTTFASLLEGVIPPIEVLIVEDNIINQKILEAFMKKRNISSEVAKDGPEALEKWKKKSFHLILMDIQLPTLSGIDVTKEIRRLERLNAIGLVAQKPSEPIPENELLPPDKFQSPVIIVALTASSLMADRNEALAAGCNDFLTKPVSLVWLEKKITEWGCMQALIDWNRWRRFRGH